LNHTSKPETIPPFKESPHDFEPQHLEPVQTDAITELKSGALLKKVIRDFNDPKLKGLIDLVASLHDELGTAMEKITELKDELDAVKSGKREIG